MTTQQKIKEIQSWIAKHGNIVLDEKINEIYDFFLEEKKMYELGMEKTIKIMKKFVKK